MSGLTYLKVKIKSLASESRTIREEKNSAKRKGDTATVVGLHHHRVMVVRPESRATQLAYAYLRGRTYRETEPCPRTTPHWAKVARMVEKYGDGQAFDIEAWVKAETRTAA